MITPTARGLAGCRLSDLAREGTTPLSSECRDKVGNLARATYAVKVDRTRPTITAVATVGGALYNAGAVATQDVIVTFTCNDALAGVAVCPPVQRFTTNGSFTASGTVTDHAGNSTTVSLGPILINKGGVQGAAAANAVVTTDTSPATADTHPSR